MTTDHHTSKMLTADDVREMLRRECEKAGGQSAWAKSHGVSPQFVCDVLSGYRAPGEAIAKGLGLVETPRTWTLDTVRDNA